MLVHKEFVRLLFSLAVLEQFAVGFDYASFQKEKNKEFSDKLFGSKCTYKEDYRNAGTVAPTVAISIFVRNKEYALPFFLKYLFSLDFPKDRISIWFVTDHNRDNSVQVLQNWQRLNQHFYHSIELDADEKETEYPDQQGDLDWPDERYVHILKLRQRALAKATSQWANYAFLVDADNMLVNPCTIWHLISRDKMVVAPLLDTITSYSNFWCDYNEETGYYQRSEDYLPIRNREKRGVHKVVLVHSTMLVDLTRTATKNLKFWPPNRSYPYRTDDFVIMLYNAKTAGVEFYIDNSETYGYMPVPVSNEYGLEAEMQTFVHTLNEFMTEEPVGLGIIPERYTNLGTSLLATNKPNGFDKVYMINLDRRADRFIQMDAKLKLHGIEYEHFHAIDAKKMNASYLEELGVAMLPGYSDPYKNRPLTYGEIGCFLSHYFIWKDIVEKGHKEVMVLEDDVRFEPYFNYRLQQVREEIEANNVQWDLIYLGRKKLHTKDEEPDVKGTKLLVWSAYSYWTVGYLLSLDGARKLLADNPLGKMLPVDEYLPIMFDRHPKEEYWSQFANRNLIGLSVNPLLIFPTHYTGQTNHYSDTETSSVIEPSTQPQPQEEKLAADSSLNEKIEL